MDTNELMSLDELKKHLGNREWRLNHLYYIKDDKGNKVLFQLNNKERSYAQKFLHDNLWYFNIVPKARQLGITTFFTILYLDQILFSKNKTAGIIAHRQEDMKKIFKHKIKYAWDNLHPWLKEQIGEPDTNSAWELSWKDPEGNTSTIFVSMTTRSGTVQFLHITEFGYICQKFPEKAEEIVTGAINSVSSGCMVSIESTAAGREGYFYEFCMTAEKSRLEGRNLTSMDWKIFFFPWYIDPRYVLQGDVNIPAEEQEYFKRLYGQHNISLTEDQQKWYVKKKETNREKMFAEYPSTLDEAFARSVEGAYYAREMNKVFSENRIRPLPYDPTLEVETWFDLGMNDQTVILFTQCKGGQIRFIDVYYNHGEGLAHYAGILKEKQEHFGYRYASHNLPHDAEVRDISVAAISRRQVLWDLGLRNMRIAPKASINEGIEKVRLLFPRFYFDREKTEKLTDALFNYRKDYDTKLGMFKDRPRHDESSHFCFSGDTKLVTKSGIKTIQDIVPGDFVSSPFGWTKVLFSGQTGESETFDFFSGRITGNHPISTQRGFIPIDTVRINDTILICKEQKKSLEKMLFIRGFVLEDTRILSIGNLGNIFSLFNKVKQAAKENDFTGLSGKRKWGKFLTDFIFIIKMATRVIMNYRIWNVYRIQSISADTCLPLKESRKVERFSSQLESQQQNGMVQKRVLNFINGLVKRVGKTDKNLKGIVSTAPKNTKHYAPTDQNSVLLGVSRGIEKVYNITTESGVYFAGGILVSNCDAVRVLGVNFRDMFEMPKGMEVMYDQSFFS